LSADEARARAQARFGSPAVAADACRDARGLSLIDATVGDVLYALRTFRRSPMVAATIVGTVALGLGLVAAVFTIFNAFVFRPDAVRDPDSLFSVRWGLSGNATAHVRFTRPRYEALRSQTDIFSGVCARLADITSRIDGRMMEGQLVTGNFFQVVGVHIVLGRPLMPEDDVRGAGRPVMVLSHSGWSRLFDSDPGVLGRRVSVSGFQYEIVGVAAEGFRGLGVLPPDYFAPLSLVGQFRPWFAGREDMVAIEVIGRLKPGLSRATAHAGLAVWAANENPVDARPALTLDPRGTATPLSPGVLLAFSPLFFAFGLILMIGCANVANLLLARAVARQREIGIRLSLGASRRRVVRQLLTESLLLALVSAAGALVISRVVLDASVSTLMRTVPPEFAELLRFDAPATDWRVAVFLIVAAIISTALFGLVPALYGTRIDLVRTIRGEFGRDGRPGRARNALIVVQVTASALLLICAGIFLRSALRSASTDPGLRTADTVVIDIVNEPFRTPMVAAVAASPSVAEVSASWPEALNRPREAFVRATAEVQGHTARFPVGYRLASPEYFSVLAIEVLRGRIYSESEARSNAAVALVSESTARRLWPKGDAVGQALWLESDPNSDTGGPNDPALPSRTFSVVGVVRDVAGFRLAGYTEAGVYIPTGPATAETNLIVRVIGDPERARRALTEQLAAIDPNTGMLLTLRTVARLETYPLQAGFWVTVVLGGLALVLTLSGIFSVLSFLVEQRSKEIGVRIALGATTRNVARLVLSQSLRLVTMGLVLGGGLAWTLAVVLMSRPAAARIGAIVHVFDPIAYGASMLCIVAACALAASMPALRAARIDPMATLRRE
jgi:predicted permease